MYTKGEFAKRVDDLEMSIMSCILIKPELMEQVLLEDKYFVKHQRMWQFMKAFYKKFGTFDTNLMYSVCKDKFQIIEYITLLLEIEPDGHNFEKYQKQLVELYEENKKDKWIKEKVYQLANYLYVGGISTQKFKEGVEAIYIRVDEIYGKEE